MEQPGKQQTDDFIITGMFLGWTAPQIGGVGKGEGFRKELLYKL
jgi:hypothetical protein